MKEGDQCVLLEAGVTKEATFAAAIQEVRRRWGHIDVLHYNVGVRLSGGDAPDL
jgi:NAD(P)-dependent dehydrogenase (short-subunit alcohol dehydrogenase family)